MAMVGTKRTWEIVCMQLLWYVVDIEETLNKDSYNLAVVLHCPGALQNRPWLYESFYRPSISPNLHYGDLPTSRKNIYNLYHHLDNRISLGHDISVHPI